MKTKGQQINCPTLLCPGVIQKRKCSKCGIEVRDDEEYDKIMLSALARLDRVSDNPDKAWRQQHLGC